MTDELEPQSIIQTGYEYLLSFDGVTEEILTKHLTLWEENQAKSLSTLYRGFLKAAYNRQGMRHSIGDIETLESVLYGFSPAQISKHYESWEEVFTEIKTRDSVTPPGPMEQDNPRNYWVQYCKSIVTGAEFFEQFDSIGEYTLFVEDFQASPYTRYSLPLLLSEEIHGFGFALACDFLKENGYPEFVKPDVHIKEIFQGLGLTDGTTDFEVFVDVIEFAEATDRRPYEVDKLFWLIGSGRFYRESPVLRISTDKQEFISQFDSLP